MGRKFHILAGKAPKLADIHVKQALLSLLFLLSLLLRLRDRAACLSSPLA